MPDEFHDVNFWRPGTVGGQQPNCGPIAASFREPCSDFPASPLHGVLVLRGGVPTGILSCAHGSVQRGEVQRAILHADAVLRVELHLVVEAPFVIGNFPVTGVGQLAIQVPIQNRQNSSLGVGGGLADAEGIHQHVATGPDHHFRIAWKIPYMSRSPGPPALTCIAAVVQRDGWVFSILESKLGVHQALSGQTDGHCSGRIQDDRHREFGVCS